MFFAKTEDCRVQVFLEKVMINHKPLFAESSCFRATLKAMLESSLSDQWAPQHHWSLHVHTSHFCWPFFHACPITGQSVAGPNPSPKLIYRLIELLFNASNNSGLGVNAWAAWA